MKKLAMLKILVHHGRLTNLGKLVISTLFIFMMITVTDKGVASQSTQMAKPVKIIVYGASGRVGSRIVREALDRGHSVAGVGRTPAKITQRHARLKIAQGNVLDTDSVVKRIAGYDVVISAVGAPNPKSDNPMLSVPRQATVSLVKALRTLGAKAPRVIVIGGAITTLDLKRGVPYFRAKDIGTITEINGITLTPSMIGHRLALDYLYSSKNIKWTFIAPPMRLRPGKRTGKFRVGNGVVLRDKQGESAISMEDLAVAIINEIEAPKYLGRRMTAAY